MEQIDKRLREASESCFKCYEAWNANQKDGAAREALQEAIHELRKVTSRLEIELAVSERNEMTQRPIPIPPHRDAQRRAHPDQEGNFADDDFNGNNGGNTGSQPRHHHQQRRRSGGGGPRKMGGMQQGGGNHHPQD